MFRKYIISSLLAKCLCSRVKWLRGADLARGRNLETPVVDLTNANTLTYI